MPSSAVHDPIDVFEVKFIGSGRIAINEGSVTVAVWTSQAMLIQLAGSHGLNDVVPLASAIPKIALGIIAIQAVKQFPCRVAEPKKWLSVRLYQIVPIGTHTD